MRLPTYVKFILTNSFGLYSYFKLRYYRDVNSIQDHCYKLCSAANKITEKQSNIVEQTLLKDRACISYST